MGQAGTHEWTTGMAPCRAARSIAAQAAVLRLGALLLAAALLAACSGGDGKGSSQAATTSTPAPPQTPVPTPVPGLPRTAWSWIPLPGTSCGDGSATGIAVNPDEGPDVLLYLDVGGICWDAVTCVTEHAAFSGPFGPLEFEEELRIAPGSVIDRAVPENPFRAATLVFVPYCTGDAHAGDAAWQYRGARRLFHHQGRVNLAAALAWAKANLPSPRKVAVAGGSGGGFGALLAFDEVKRAWPDARGYLVDDSGPPLVGDDFAPAVLSGWFSAWQLDETVLPLCPGCALDLSGVVSALARKYPGDRFALLSWTRDPLIRGTVGLGPDAFEVALRRLSESVFAPLPNAEVFLVPGEGHTMIRSPRRFTAGGVPLFEWLRRQVEDDPAWTSVGP